MASPPSDETTGHTFEQGFNDHLGQRLTETRIDRGFSRQKVGRTLRTNYGMSQMQVTTLRRIELGQRPMKVVELVAIAEVLGLEPTELLDEPRPNLDRVQEAYAQGYQDGLGWAAKHATQEQRRAAVELKGEGGLTAG